MTSQLWKTFIIALDKVLNLFPSQRISTIFRVLCLLFIAIPLLLFFCKWLRIFITNKASAQQGLIVGKSLQYIGLVIILLTVIHELGFSLAPLLGAAGIVGIALGFASQTSVSNIISGIFLIIEERLN